MVKKVFVSASMNEDARSPSDPNADGRRLHPRSKGRCFTVRSCGRYYEVHSENMRHQLTILAYEQNGAPVGVQHGSPLRFRCENELGIKNGHVSSGSGRL